MIRMPIIGYCVGIRSERRLCEEVHLNLAYRWFCRLGLDGDVPDHSTFSKNRHGRFRESDLLRRVFETVLQRCIEEGLVGGEGFAVDASLTVSEAGGLLVVTHKHIDQMICDRQDNSPHTGPITELTPADVPAMLHLVELTKPGPFSAGAIELGSYLGIRYAGKLIAMAGERMRFDGFTEISAVCTHPGYRGCGYASSLVRALVRQINTRGETPFLHLYSDNTIAAALYTKLGFALQRRLIVTVLRRAN